MAGTLTRLLHGAGGLEGHLGFQTDDADNADFDSFFISCRALLLLSFPPSLKASVCQPLRRFIAVPSQIVI